MSDNNCIFVFQNRENDIAKLKVYACRKEYYEDLIKSYEESDGKAEGSEFPYEIIAKVPANVTLDFAPNQIEWYEKGEKEKQLIDKVVLAVINHLM